MDGDGGDIVFSGKSEKEGVRRLMSVNCEMGSSDGEDELRPTTTSISKRFIKPPRKFSDDCNAVDHASVPRKLRSAMKKRNHESISPPLPDKKKPNYGKDCRKKSVLNQKRDSVGSPSQIIEVPITKEEEEVVETLNALAVMFPFPINNKKDLDCELGNAKSSVSLEGESARPAFQDSTAPEKEDSSTTTTAEAANPSMLLGSALETVQVKCLNEPSQLGTQLRMELDNTISQSNLQALLLTSKSEPIDRKPSCSYVGCNVQSDLNLGAGSKQPKREEASAYTGKPENAAGLAAAVSSQNELQHTLEEKKNGDSVLWPGLFSPGSHGSRTRAPSLKSSAAKTPGWLDMASSATQPGSLDNSVLSDKDSMAPVARKKSWKRCSAHIYICRLIKVLEIAERKDGSLVQPTQLTPNEGSRQGVLLEANNLNGVQSGFNGAVSANNIVRSAAEKNPDELRNAILLHKRLLQDQQQASTATALYTPQKQCFDFLSLSNGGGGVETIKSTSKVGNVLDPLTQFHIPYLHSLGQNHAVLPFSLPQIHFRSTPFTDYPMAPAKQVPIPPPPLLCPPHLGSSASPKQEQQQWIWTTRYNPTGVATTGFPNWQNGRQDPSGMHYAQTILPPSHSSLEVLGPKYFPFSQQQQLIAATSSSPTAISRRQHHHLPPGYKGNGVGSCPDTAMPLQLLCSEHL